MASGDLYEVEKIVDKRKTRKGKWEYLIRWKGYGRSEDTWEPEHHLLHCEEFIQQFQAQRVPRDRPARPARTAAPAPHPFSRAADSQALRGRGEPQKKKRASGGGAAGAQRPRRVADRPARSAPHRSAHGELHFLPFRRSHHGLQNGVLDPLRYRNAPKVHRIRRGRAEDVLGDIDVREPPIKNELGAALSNGGINVPSSAKRKLAGENGYVFDKRLRHNVRQNQGNCRYRDIVVRKEDGFTHILLSSQTSDNNALTPEIMEEVCRALGAAAVDSSKLLLLSAVGSVFCSGLDRSYLIGRLSKDRRKESGRISETIRDFVKAFIQFKKPIVVAINGPALGLGASILPLCDVVWASEKAWFQTPGAMVRLTPMGCSSYTFPQILGVALANEMLFCGRKLTAQEACSRGLVSQVFWASSFSQEVMLRVRDMASCSAVVLEESKGLVRSFLKSLLEEVNERECQILKQLWSSTKGSDSLFSGLQGQLYEG
ncbi:chromodomain Y-like protein 2 [Conger conger]|uniref:chromodomain Y-like protein 2 n=1 Tax=Conger conger TaxID=82655 RepID=UPI002A5A232D|nr:chromodomain Y-like protein 2 [Conger conger]